MSGSCAFSVGFIQRCRLLGRLLLAPVFLTLAGVGGRRAQRTSTRRAHSRDFFQERREPFPTEGRPSQNLRYFRPTFCDSRERPGPVTDRKLQSCSEDGGAERFERAGATARRWRHQ